MMENHLPIWWNCKIEDPVRMSCESCQLWYKRKRQTQHQNSYDRELAIAWSLYLWHARISPNNYLVLGVTMGADKFIDIFRPHKIANLRWRLNQYFVYGSCTIQDNEHYITSKKDMTRVVADTTEKTNSKHRKHLHISPQHISTYKMFIRDNRPSTRFNTKEPKSQI